MKGKLIHEFGPFRLEPAERRLLRQGRPINLSPQLFSLLLVFVENPDKLISKEALRNKVWGSAYVSEDALKVIIGNLRKAIGENGERYIETVRGGGYRFICPVRVAEEHTAAPEIVPGMLATAPGKEADTKAGDIEATPEASSVLTEPDIELQTPSGQSSHPRALTFGNRKIIFWALCVMVAAAALVIVALWFSGKREIQQYGRRSNAVQVPIFSAYDFEDGEQGWTARPQMMISRVFSSNAHAYEGKRSLAIIFDDPYSRKSQVYVENPPIKAGRTVTARILCPADTQLAAIAWFVEDREYTWSNDWQPVSRLIPGGWNKFSVRIPADAPTPLARLGIEFTADAAWKGTCYLDAVEWQ